MVVRLFKIILRVIHFAHRDPEEGDFYLKVNSTVTLGFLKCLVSSLWDFWVGEPRQGVSILMCRRVVWEL